MQNSAIPASMARIIEMAAVLNSTIVSSVRQGERVIVLGVH